MSAAEEQLAFHLRCENMDGWVREYRFDDARRWRFDFAWPESKFAVEIEGGVYMQGRHSRGQGIEKDLEKYQAAMLQGWTVYRVTPRMVRGGAAISTIRSMLIPVTPEEDEAFERMGGR